MHTSTPAPAVVESPRFATKLEATMIPALTRYTAQQLRLAGVSQRTIAAQLGISVRSVRRVCAEAPISDPADPDLRRSKRIGRPSKAAPYRNFVASRLRSEPKLLGVELLRLAREMGYEGGKSAFLDMVSGVRDRDTPFVCRFEGLPGEFSQHDFGQVQVTYDTGHSERIRFFASRLKWSRYAAVTVVADETAETLTRTLLEHFGLLGGIPMLAVFDRPKTVAVKWERDGTITEWNSTFALAATEIGFLPEVCWPYSPNQKGSVERIVGWVKGSFFKQRRFHDRADLEAQLAEWLVEINERTPSRATGELPSVRRDAELPRLRAPRVTPDSFAIRRPIKASPAGKVPFEGREFSVDPELRGRSGTMYVYKDRLRLEIGGVSAEHERYPEAKRVTLPEHRAARLELLTRRGRQYGARQHLLDLGSVAEEFLTPLCHATPKWEPLVMRLHELLQAHGDDTMRRALRACVDVGRCDVPYLEALLPTTGREEVAA